MPTLFTLIEGYDLPVQKLLVESLLRYNPEVKIFTRQSVSSLPGGPELLERTRELNLVHFSDVFRAWYLYEFGGTWIDADCVFSRPFEFPYDLEPIGCAFMYEDHQCTSLTQCFIHAPVPKNEFLGALLERQSQLLRDKGANGLQYLDLGSWSIDHIRTNTHLKPQVIPHWEYSYIAWYSRPRFGECRPWDKFQYDRGIYSPNSYAWHLTNGVVWDFRNTSHEDLMTSDTFLSFLLRRALTNGYEGTKHFEILNRLPDHLGKYKYVEVGVLKGHNTAIIGQQRNNSHIFCVDPWRNISSIAYRTTEDYVAFLSDQQHEDNFQETRRNQWFLDSQQRTTYIREPSVEGAKQFSDEEVDLVFIDGDHSAKAVEQDIAAWWPKVKQGGYISGHDYKFPTYKFGVELAVDSFAQKNGLSLELGGDYTWFIRKP